MTSTTSQWVDDIVQADNPGKTAEEITAARVVVALESRHRRPFRNSNARANTMNEFRSSSGLVVLANPDPFSQGVINPRSVSDGQRALVIDDVLERYALPEHARHIMQSATTNMHAAAQKLSNTTGNLSLRDMSAMTQQDLYRLFETEGNGERHKRLPLAHVYMGDVRYHPYLGTGTVPLFSVAANTNTTFHRSIEGRGRSVPHEILGYGGVIVHPQSAELFQAFGARRPHLDAVPTTSTRTLYEPVGDFHIKTTFDAIITGSTRWLKQDECSKALAMSQVLYELYERGALSEKTHFLPDLRWVADSRNPYANVLIRGGLQDIFPTIEKTARVIPVSASATRLPFAGGRTLLEMLVEQNGIAFFEKLLRLRIDSHFQMEDRGVSHERHAQNSLYVFNQDFTDVEICIRDCESINIDPARLATFGVSAQPFPGYEPPTSPEETPEGRTARFCRCLLNAQIGIEGIELISGGHTSAGAIERQVKGAVADCMTPYNRTWLRPNFYTKDSTEPILTGRRVMHEPPGIASNLLWGSASIGQERSLGIQ